MTSLLHPAPLLLIMAFLAPVAAVLVGRVRPDLAARAGGLFAVAAFGVTIWGATWSSPSRVDVGWASSWGLRLTFSLDGLAVVFSLLATGIGAVVVAYSERYIPIHLHHEDRPQQEIQPFLGYLLLFMAAMVGLVMAEDMIAFFLFWDLTAIASFFLIGFDRDEPSTRASLTAIVVTGVTAILILIGMVMLSAHYHTWNLAQIIATVNERGDGLPTTGITVAVALIAVGGLAKSAQAPFHFWLPQAMAAPTPVSSYLHSAAMVAAGVFLVGRFYPLIDQSDLLLWGLRIMGLASMVVGGIIALSRQHLKQILAYSTISQYGYVTLMFGLGGTYGVAGACFYVMVHGIAKCGLFLMAGAAIETTGETDLNRMGGLLRRRPLLAFGSFLAAATLAALPLTLGFFKDELLFGAALHTGPFWVGAAISGAVLTFVYISRLWVGVFVRPAPTDAPPLAPLPLQLVWPVVLLGGLGLVGGMVPGIVTHLASEAAEVASAGHSLGHVHTAYHLDTRPENLMALAVWGLGLVLVVAEPVWRTVVSDLATLGDRAGPARIYTDTLALLNRYSAGLRRFEVRDIRSRVATILAPGGLLIIGGILASHPATNVYRVGSITAGDLLTLLMIGTTMLSAITATVARDHFALSLVLSGVGFSLACVYAFMHATNVALVAVLIETVFTILFVATLVLLPRWILRDMNQEPESHHHNRRDAAIAVASGLVTLIVVWSTLSRPSTFASVGLQYRQLAPDAHGSNIVSVILADFRGLDTLGEISVIGIALLGVAGLLYRGRLR